MNNPTEFDVYAKRYEEALNEGLSLTGECADYYAELRVQATKRLADKYRKGIERVLDFGCGTGSSIPYLNDAFKPLHTIGVVVSSDSLLEARGRVRLANASFHLVDEKRLHEEIDLGFCNGVFHHIDPEFRGAALGYIFSALRPGGLFAFWENNPFNPGTLAVMARCPFDRTAKPINPLKAKRLLEIAGFQLLVVHSQFFFPRAFSVLRGLEPLLSWTMLGGQYLVLAQKPTLA
jgi:SAM-dependent methyltransferase